MKSRQRRQKLKKKKKRRQRAEQTKGTNSIESRKIYKGTSYKRKELHGSYIIFANIKVQKGFNTYNSSGKMNSLFSAYTCVFSQPYTFAQANIHTHSQGIFFCAQQEPCDIYQTVSSVRTTTLCHVLRASFTVTTMPGIN